MVSGMVVMEGGTRYEKYMLDTPSLKATDTHQTISYQTMADFHDFLDPFWDPEDIPEPSPPARAPPEKYHLQVPGKGIISARSTAKESLLFKVSPNEDGDTTLSLEIKKDGWSLWTTKGGTDTQLTDSTDVLKLPPKSPYLRSAKPGSAVVSTVYWLSIDRSNAVIRYGKDLPNKALTNLELRLDKEADKWIESLVGVDVTEDGGVGSEVESCQTG